MRNHQKKSHRMDKLGMEGGVHLGGVNAVVGRGGGGGGGQGGRGGRVR